MARYNPYYNPDQFDLDLFSLDEPGLSYEYNTLCFWATKDGRVFTAQDSGCSCPTPFEDYEGENQKEVLQKLEQVGSVEQAERTFDSWNGRRDNGLLPQRSRDELSAWVKSRLTSETHLI